LGSCYYNTLTVAARPDGRRRLVAGGGEVEEPWRFGQLQRGEDLAVAVGQFAALRDLRVAAADKTRSTQIAMANALNSTADRIEKTTQVLNRTIGGGVAIG